MLVNVQSGGVQTHIENYLNYFVKEIDIFSILNEISKLDPESQGVPEVRTASAQTYYNFFQSFPY